MEYRTKAAVKYVCGKAVSLAADIKIIGRDWHSCHEAIWCLFVAYTTGL